MPVGFQVYVIASVADYEIYQIFFGEYQLVLNKKAFDFLFLVPVNNCCF